jgi:hypothetical protein
MNMLQITRKSFLLASLIVAASGSVAYGQGGQGRGMGSPMYDPKTETTLSGVIQEVKEIAGQGRSTGTHLMVKTGTEVVEVHVGPTWYLKEQKCEFKKDAQVEIIGSKVKLQGTDVIIARQIKEGGNTWTLRDAQGIPAWSQGRNR